MYLCLSFICEQLQAQNDEGQCDASRQEYNISVGKSSHHYYTVSSIQSDTFLFIHAPSFFFCHFHLFCLHKINSDWFDRLLIFCVQEKVMQCFTQLLNTVAPHAWDVSQRTLKLDVLIFMLDSFEYFISRLFFLLYFIYSFYICLFCFYILLSACHTCVSTNKIIMAILGCMHCQSGFFHCMMLYCLCVSWKFTYKKFGDTKFKQKKQFLLNRYLYLLHVED